MWTRCTRIPHTCAYTILNLTFYRRILGFENIKGLFEINVKPHLCMVVFHLSRLRQKNYFSLHILKGRINYKWTHIVFKNAPVSLYMHTEKQVCRYSYRRVYEYEDRGEKNQKSYDKYRLNHYIWGAIFYTGRNCLGTQKTQTLLWFVDQQDKE